MQALHWQKIIPLATRWLLSVSLVFAFIHNFQFSEGFFALVTIAAIIRLTPTETCTRSILRAFGTIIGAILTYCLLQLAHGNITILIIGSVMISFIAGYLMFQSLSLSYVGVMIGVTMANILALSQMTGSDLYATCDRVFFVFFGMFCMFVVDVLFTLVMRQKIFIRQILCELWIECVSFKKENQKSHLIAALQLAIATAITIVPWLIFHYQGGYWAVVSCFFVIEESLPNVALKGQKRFSAHFLAAILGGLIVLIATYKPELRFPLLLLFIFIISIFMVEHKKIAEISNTMGVALVIMAMGGSDATVIYRLGYTILGIVVGLLICKIFSKRWYFVENQHV